MQVKLYCPIEIYRLQPGMEDSDLEDIIDDIRVSDAVGYADSARHLFDEYLKLDRDATKHVDMPEDLKNCDFTIEYGIEAESRLWFTVSYTFNGLDTPPDIDNLFDFSVLQVGEIETDINAYCEQIKDGDDTLLIIFEATPPFPSCSCGSVGGHNFITQEEFEQITSHDMEQGMDSPSLCQY